jgi:predicted  nucleic acid-binding Zn-ribbon protein
MANETVRDALQDALVRANQKRFDCHDAVSKCQLRIVDLKANVQPAATEKAKADFANADVMKKYRALLDHCNGLTDQAARNALTEEIEALAKTQHTTHQRAQVAAEAVRERQRDVVEAETELGVAENNLKITSEHWSQIAKQIVDLQGS